ncbi:bcl-2-like protein 1 isoform X2 [Microcaecilia unicolor]|nr:bcl-2-like protein 1 isoform X2 [Microcaecilia unicolor]XP_030045208.1 bcl-2-like protein 1 isoform X2 [Microcaecilia unicolor]XP_030068836.1 bcl-2-like protein 1 isoform X2 [Microcaecilia unicolor]
MSDVTRALILDFIAYKLLQKGHNWTELDINGCRLDAADGVTVVNGSSSVHGVSLAWNPGVVAGTVVKQTLREAGDEFELRYRRAFSNLTSQLYITPDTAYQSFQQVVSELFRDGVNWGRIIAFFSFGGALSVESVDKEMAGLVQNITTWMTLYFSQHLEPWIHENGGWTAFVDLYGNNAAAESRRQQEKCGRWLLTGITLAGVLLLGSYLCRK